MTSVDLGLPEVRVDGGGQPETRREAVEQVEAGLAVDIVSAGAAQVEPAPCHERAKVKTDPLRQVAQLCDLSSLGHLKKLGFEAGSGPSVVFELSINVASDVEAPHACAGRKAEALERNRKFSHPSVVRPARAHLPDGIPVGIEFSVRKGKAVDQRAGRVGCKVEGAALIAERIEHDLDAIVGVQPCIASHLCADDRIGLRVVSVNAYIEIVGVAQERDVGPLTWRLARVRLPLDEIADRRGGFPFRFVESAVDRNRTGYRGNGRGPHGDRVGRILCHDVAPTREKRTHRKRCHSAEWFHGCEKCTP